MGKDVCSGHRLSVVSQVWTEFRHYFGDIIIFLILTKMRSAIFFFRSNLTIYVLMWNSFNLQQFLATNSILYGHNDHKRPWPRPSTATYLTNFFRLSNGIPLFTKNFLTVFLQTNGKNFACRPFSKCILGRQSIIRY